MKNLNSLETLSSALARTLVTIIGFFSIVWGLLLAITILVMTPDSASLVFLLGLGILPPLILLPLAFFSHRYLIGLIAHPIAHLIANTQLGCVQKKTLRQPSTRITEINILGRSINHMTAKLLQRENFTINSEKRLSLALSGSSATFEQEYRSRRSSTNEWFWIQIRGSIVEREHIGRPIRMAGLLVMSRSEKIWSNSLNFIPPLLCAQKMQS